MLLSEGFRLPDGRCDNTLYPMEAAYENAARVKNYARISAIFQEATQILRQNVYYTRSLTSADEPVYQLIVLIYVIILVVWTASVMQRAMQKKVRFAALVTGILLLGWITVRLINYQLSTINCFRFKPVSLVQLLSVSTDLACSACVVSLGNR